MNPIVPSRRIAFTFRCLILAACICPGILCAQERQPQKVHSWLEPADSKTTIYDKDPRHLWNRLHEAFWVRRDKDGRALGRDLIDPLLWDETIFVLDGEAFQRAKSVLREFNEKEGESLIRDPLKRAMLQRDLWSVFDWLVYDDNRFDYPTLKKVDYVARIKANEQQLVSPLAEAISRLALSRDEIERLPDTYSAAVASREFGREFDPANFEQPFLPPDLFDPKGSWLAVTQYVHNELTPQHHGRLPRSEFLVLIKLPAGREATVAYVKQLDDYKDAGKMKIERSNVIRFGDDAPQVPVGTQLALVRRMQLLDTDAQIRATSLVESVQIRVFRTIEKGRDSQAAVEFVLSRDKLLNNTNARHNAGGLRATLPNETKIKPSINPHSFDLLEYDHAVDHTIESRAFNSLKCLGCHARSAGVHAIESFRNHRALRANSDYAANAESARRITGRRYGYGILKGLWKSSQKKDARSAKIEQNASRIREAIGDEWTVTTRENEILIERVKPVAYADVEINAPAVSSPEKAAVAEAEKETHEKLCRLTLRFAEPIALSKYEKLRAENQAMEKRYDRLRASVRHISHKFDDYLPANEKEKQQLAEFRRDVAKLHFHDLPDFFTENASVRFYRSWSDWEYLHDPLVRAQVADVEQTLLRLFGVYQPRVASDSMSYGRYLDPAAK